MDNEELVHYGTPRHSGRYPWGSGDNPYQRSFDFKSKYHDLRKQGLSQVEVAKSFGMNTTELRKRIALADEEIEAARTAEVMKLRAKGMGPTAIERRTGIPESTVRSIMKRDRETKAKTTEALANRLKDCMNEEHPYLDVGSNVNLHLGVTQDKLSTAIRSLQNEGYETHIIKVKQPGTGNNTTMKVLTKAGVTNKEIYRNLSKIEVPGLYSDDNGKTVRPIEPPRSIDSKRVQVRYAEEGGRDMDGVIELRRGIPELSMGKARYAQVRIAVDGTHYLKGMAIYADDLPDGVDIRFNTNKHTGTPMLGPKDNTVLKPMKTKKGENPFGATIKLDDELILAQRHYKDKDGNEQLSCLNIVNEEGNWDKWKKTLSSQVLSKQRPELAKRQLKMAYDISKTEFDDIMAYNNPTIKKKLLESFADQCDSDAVHLKAAGMPRQHSRVILPLPNMKENEIYAPDYKDGERVVLIRYPHAGTFEIPELTVNNKNPDARRLFDRARDAVGIHPKTAERLSGADFDGDTVLVIPNNEKLIKTTHPLKGLEGFDPKERYPGYEGMPKMTNKTKQNEMGRVSNLITDMTIKGANPDEIARAVRHSMVVIDAEKHNLNYKQSFEDNRIAELKKDYQGGENKGASTLISKASSSYRIPKREEGIYVTDPDTGRTRRLYSDPETGKKLYTEKPSTYESATIRVTDSETGKNRRVKAFRFNGDEDEVRGKGSVFTDPETGDRFYVPKKNIKDTETIVGSPKTKTEERTQESTWMYETEDAYRLSSGSPIENVYAEHANKLKALGNQARKEALSIKDTTYNPEAKKEYAEEVASLNAKLRTAKRNAPLERKAIIRANVDIKSYMDENPDADKDDLKKFRNQALKLARERIGAKKTLVDITDREYEAIQKGAISPTRLKDIIDNADEARVKELAMPRTQTGLPPAKLTRAKAYYDRGYTPAQIADMLGVSASTIRRALDGKEDT